MDFVEKITFSTIFTMMFAIVLSFIIGEPSWRLIAFIFISSLAILHLTEKIRAITNKGEESGTS